MLPILALSTLFLQGCSTLGTSENSDFGCKALPEGVSCLSASQIYKETNTKAMVNAQNLSTNKKKVKNNNGVLSSFGGNQVQTATTNFTQGAQDYYNRKFLSINDAPIPLKTQHSVMRIWIAPWIDKNEELHSGEFVFKNIVNSEWAIGSRIADTGNAGVRKTFSKQKIEEKEKKKGGISTDQMKKIGTDSAMRFMKNGS